MIKEIAKMLDGREYGDEVTPEIRQLAKDNGIVIVYGASDDLMELDGAFGEEVDVCDGDTVYITPIGLFDIKCGIGGCPCAGIEREQCKAIKAVWCRPGEPAWTYETDIPHETFDIYEDGKVYCRGIVFYAEDVK